MPYKIDGYFKDKIEGIFVLSLKTITIYSTYVRSHSRFSQTYKTGIFATKGLHFGKDFLNFNLKLCINWFGRIFPRFLDHIELLQKK